MTNATGVILVMTAASIATTLAFTNILLGKIVNVLTEIAAALAK